MLLFLSHLGITKRCETRRACILIFIFLLFSETIETYKKAKWFAQGCLVKPWSCVIWLKIQEFFYYKILPVNESNCKIEIVIHFNIFVFYNFLYFIVIF